MVRLFWLFFKIGICSAISFKRSRRELSFDVAEHRSTLKNYQNTHYPRIQNRYSIPQSVVFTVYKARNSDWLRLTGANQAMVLTDA